MRNLFENLTNGHVTAVKVVLASIAAALACYQVFLISVGYGKLRLGFLHRGPASGAHRALGDTLVVILVVVAAMCISFYGFSPEEDRGGETLHIVTGSALLVALALKIAVVRWWHALGRLLPALGATVFVLLGITWITSAARVLT